MYLMLHICKLRWSVCKQTVLVYVSASESLLCLSMCKQTMFFMCKQTVSVYVLLESIGLNDRTHPLFNFYMTFYNQIGDIFLVLVWKDLLWYIPWSRLHEYSKICCD